MAHEALWEALTDVLDRRSTGEAAVVAALEGPGHALSPWALWTLIAIARHLNRQQKLDEYVRAELGVDLRRVARSGRVVLPDHVPRRGRLGVYGTYRFYERHIRFDHDSVYHSVKVDLVDGDVEHVALWLLAEWISGESALRHCDMRLYGLHPSCETLEYAFDELFELGLIVLRPGITRLARLSAEAEPYASKLVEVGYGYGGYLCGTPVDHLGVAARLGDWLEADRLAQRSGERTEWARGLTAPRAAAQQAERRDRLLALHRADRDGRALLSLIELDAMAAAPYVRAVLAGPPDQRCAAAMDAIRFRGPLSYQPNPDYGADVIALLRRIDREELGFGYAIWPLCAGFLLDRGLYVDEVIAAFSSLPDIFTSGAAILAFQHAPDLAVPLLRRALHATSPVTRADAVAILLLINEPWCAPVLAEALETSADPEGTLEWRAGLQVLEDPGSAVRVWDASHPLTEEDRACIVRAEVWIRKRVGDLRNDVARACAGRKETRPPACS
jgi:hypothetical protein